MSKNLSAYFAFCLSSLAVCMSFFQITKHRDARLAQNEQILDLIKQNSQPYKVVEKTIHNLNDKASSRPVFDTVSYIAPADIVERYPDIAAISVPKVEKVTDSTFLENGDMLINQRIDTVAYIIPANVIRNIPR